MSVSRERRDPRGAKDLPVLQNSSPRLPGSSCSERDGERESAKEATGGREGIRRLTDVDVVSSLVSKGRAVLLDLTRIRGSSIDDDLKGRKRNEEERKDQDKSRTKGDGERARRTVGRLYRAAAMRAAGMFLSHPGIRTPASYWDAQMA